MIMDVENLIIKNCCVLLLTSKYTNNRNRDVVIRLTDRMIKFNLNRNDYDNILHILYWLSPYDEDSKRRLEVAIEDLYWLRCIHGDI